MNKKNVFLFVMMLLFVVAIYFYTTTVSQNKDIDGFIPRFEECLMFDYKMVNEKEFLRNGMSCTTYFKDNYNTISQEEIDELYDEFISGMPEGLDALKHFKIIKEKYAFQSNDSNHLNVYYGNIMKNKEFQSTRNETWLLINDKWYKDRIVISNKSLPIYKRYHGYSIIKGVNR